MQYLSDRSSGFARLTRGWPTLNAIAVHARSHTRAVDSSRDRAPTCQTRQIADHVAIFTFARPFLVVSRC